MAANHTTIARPMSKKLVLSYIIDWVVVVAIAGVGLAVSRTTPYHRPFDLNHPDISFPHLLEEQISTSVLGAIVLAAPAIIIFLICLSLVPGTSVRRSMPKSVLYRLKLWEWHVGWLGLALALATTYLFTEGTKNLTGKPRPDMLGRCSVDLTKISTSTVGGFGDRVPRGVLLVSSAICSQKDKKILNGGFKSFPSGHASLSFAGMTYLTLFICSKFALRIPYLLAEPHRRMSSGGSTADVQPSISHSRPSAITFIRHQSAAPPLYLVILALIPTCAAVYVSSTRYTDFRHHGIDILSGAALGFVLAWASFRMYHLPVRRGAGWSWGPRSIDRAWGVGLGVLSYADGNEWEVEEKQKEKIDGAAQTWPSHSGSRDLESGTQFEIEMDHRTER